MNESQSIEEKAISYGVQFEGTLVGLDYHEGVSDESMTLKQISDAGGKITRVRILAERGYGNISYIHATLPDGKIVRVVINSGYVSGMVQMKTLMANFIAWGKEEGVYAKGLGLLDRFNVWSVMYG